MAQPQNTAEQSVDQKTIVSMRNVNKWFGQFHVLRDINLSVDKRRTHRCLWAIRFGQINS